MASDADINTPVDLYGAAYADQAASVDRGFAELS
jgi:hypothetical protein